jgi:hypothetical protein
MVTDQLDAFGAGSLDDVDARPVLGLLVEIHGHQTVEAVAEIVHHGNRLDENLWHDDGAAQVHPDASFHGGNDAAQAPKIDEGSLAQGRAADVRMHVDNIGAEGDVNGARNAGAISRQYQARLRMRTVEAVEVLAQRPAESAFVFRSVAGGHGEGVGSFSGHAELAGRKLRRDVLAGLTGDGEFKIMYRRRTVQRHRLEDSVLNPVDQIGRAPGLDDVPSQRRRRRTPVRMSAAQVASDPQEPGYAALSAPHASSKSVSSAPPWVERCCCPNNQIWYLITDN